MATFRDYYPGLTIPTRRRDIDKERAAVRVESPQRRVYANKVTSRSWAVARYGGGPVLATCRNKTEAARLVAFYEKQIAKGLLP